MTSVLSLCNHFGYPHITVSHLHSIEVKRQMMGRWQQPIYCIWTQFIHPAVHKSLLRFLPSIVLGIYASSMAGYNPHCNAAQAYTSRRELNSLNPSCHKQKHPAWTVVLQWKGFLMESIINKPSLDNFPPTSVCNKHRTIFKDPNYKAGVWQAFLRQSPVPMGQNTFHTDKCYIDGYLWRWTDSSHTLRWHNWQDKVTADIILSTNYLQWLQTIFTSQPSLWHTTNERLRNVNSDFFHNSQGCVLSSLSCTQSFPNLSAPSEKIRSAANLRSSISVWQDGTFEFPLACTDLVPILTFRAQNNTTVILRSALLCLKGHSRDRRETGATEKRTSTFCSKSSTEYLLNTSQSSAPPWKSMTRNLRQNPAPDQAISDFVTSAIRQSHSYPLPPKLPSNASYCSTLEDASFQALFAYTKQFFSTKKTIQAYFPYTLKAIS